ncbi:urease accessory protein UreF [Metabacillus sediminilitoris]|uniref:Urease accessory protein UreF n=1 Tax=Metabacillus sediminilitoris TaxID=2567941 RepID=A0A4S4BYX0_9BACI|nr:urease accessory protein UreF [Metabacillus sediminilitoris]QGQ47132.1 urease accessory protein UreF [Metabacillus sediminilitoris]THF80477.1 urease accessory protein UreF [Metabacillus sediminilitoris]
MTNKLFHLLQICDSNFPSGIFSHSFGLETYIQENKIFNKDTFLIAIKQFLQTQFLYTDGFACRIAYESLKINDLEKVWQLDQELFSLANARETREGNRRIGRQQVKVFNELFINEQLKIYEAKIKAKQVHGHSSIVFAMVCFGLKIDLQTTLSCYLFATASSLIQNGVRGIPLGQTDGQKLLLELQSFLGALVEEILQCEEEVFGANATGLEIAQMMHEQLSVRLFMS